MKSSKNRLVRWFLIALGIVPAGFFSSCMLYAGALQDVAVYGTVSNTTTENLTNLRANLLGGGQEDSSTVDEFGYYSMGFWEAEPGSYTLRITGLSHTNERVVSVPSVPFRTNIDILF